MNNIYYNALLGGFWSGKYYHHVNGKCEIHPSCGYIKTEISYKQSFDEERCVYCGEKGIVIERNSYS